ncbi:metal-dependent transcriptional regulator [Desulfitobacterium sp. Sab5]|uniref:metal-dependent transcriptional regulator n=1 Tax=Desulfitobacterium nosdiversum TaxID=3375356 RepID=UPI003CF83CAB
MLSPSLEDYLEEIYRISQSSQIVRVSDISNKLKVTLPSVSKAFRKLKDQQYIIYQPYGEIELTEKGRVLGSFLVKRNQLLQEFLELICSKCDIAAEAEAMEHYLSLATIESIQSLVTFMKSNSEFYANFLQFLSNLPGKETLL